MSLIPGGSVPLVVPAQETLPQSRELRDPVAIRQIPKGEAAARYQAEQHNERRASPDDSRGQRVDIDA